MGQAQARAAHAEAKAEVTNRGVTLFFFFGGSVKLVVSAIVDLDLDCYFQSRLLILWDIF